MYSEDHFLLQMFAEAGYFSSGMNQNTKQKGLTVKADNGVSAIGKLYNK